MRGAMIGVGVLVLAGLVAFFVFRPAPAPEGGAAQPTGAVDGGAESQGDGGVGPGSGPVLSEADRQALAQLRAELSEAEPVEHRSDAERLADARAWVEANRPADRPYNEIEAQILALMDVIFDGEKRSTEWLMNQSQMEVEMIRALDADGDGQVSDAEVEMFIDENIAGMFNPIEHPYLKDRLDTDRDGELSPQEMARVGEVMGEGAMSGAFERAKLEAWDADNDGFISADERVAGEAAAAEQAREIFGGMIANMAGQEGAEAANILLGDATLTPEEQAAARETYYQEIGPEAAQMLEAQRQMMLSQSASMEFLEAMRVDNLPSPDIGELMAEMPQPPDAMAFDIDGDGALADDEQAAQMQAMQDYQAAVARWGSEVTAYRLKAQFDNSLAQSDADGDGRMSPAEWESRLDELLYERDQRLFERSYDTDGSGRVEAGELVEFMDWYRAGSQRADFNYDGSVDALDLEGMAKMFQNQG